jgi:hypothetical protein
VDCLETLEEIAMQNAERFVAAGGGELRYIPALNTRAEHVSFLSSLIADNTCGWIEKNHGAQPIPREGSSTLSPAHDPGAAS